jgi:transcriptional regulator with XRE-family HTH domain
MPTTSPHHGTDRARLGARIRHARTDAGLSRFRLGVLLDVDPSTIQRWENGGTVGAEHLLPIARATGVTVSHLIGEDGNEEAVA